MPTEGCYQSALRDLIQLGPQRVWSLLVTVFGDLAQNAGDEIEGPVLSALMTEMDVKPEALRVALHRLRADDWIVSRKVGRTSRHGLSAGGRRQSRAAVPVIYGRPEDMAQSWKVIISESVTDDQRRRYLDAGYAPLMPRVFIGAGNAREPDRTLVLRPDRAPAWLGHQFEPKDLLLDYDALHAVLLGIQRRPPDARALGSRQIAVLRCLIVHAWRRLVLRHPDLPPQVYTEQWKGHACRALVIELLDQFPRPSLPSLHERE